MRLYMLRGDLLTNGVPDHVGPDCQPDHRRSDGQPYRPPDNRAHHEADDKSHPLAHSEQPHHFAERESDCEPDTSTHGEPNRQSYHQPDHRTDHVGPDSQPHGQPRMQRS